MSSPIRNLNSFVIRHSKFKILIGEDIIVMVDINTIFNNDPIQHLSRFFIKKIIINN